MPPYIYTPLRSLSATRLITIQPGPGHEPIRCSIVEVDLDNNPEYDALSYTWEGENVEDPVDIEVNHARASIPHNLFCFLQELRCVDVNHKVWVDALSISQTDLDEKSTQVMMMARIFKQAACVRAWLGPHADNSEALFRLSQDSQVQRSSLRAQCGIIAERVQDLYFLSLAAFTVTLFGLWLVFCRKTNTGDGINVGLLVLEMLGILVVRMLTGGFTTREYLRQLPEWKAFIRRRYWSRVWIVQEVALARSLILHCGHDAADWESFIDARLNLDEPHPPLIMFGQPVGRQEDHTYWRRLDDDALRFLSSFRQHMASGRPPEFSITGLTWATRGLCCTDQRDRIYALLALESSSAGGEAIVPDYRIGVLELFLKVLQLRPNGRRKRTEVRHSTMLCGGFRLTAQQRCKILRSLPFSLLYIQLVQDFLLIWAVATNWATIFPHRHAVDNEEVPDHV